MTIPLEIKNWLLIAFQQEVDDSSEYFYFDKKKNEFFSVHIIDLYLFDKKMKIINGVSLYFTQDELSNLRERIKKINKNNSSILRLPRLGKCDEASELISIIQQFITENKIDIKTSTYSEVFQKTPIQHDKKANSKKQWWKFWE